MHSVIGTYICLFLLSTIFGETSSQLLPPFADTNGLLSARSQKKFENGVVSCGKTFCDAKRCVKKGDNLLECTDDKMN